MLAEEGLAGLAWINRELISRVETVDSPRGVMLDMDLAEIPVYGQQGNSAYKGHPESTCYHPPPLLNREGDCLAAQLRRPEIERQQKLGQEVVFRAGAGGRPALAEPELDEMPEERSVKDAIRIPGNGSPEREIAE